MNNRIIADCGATKIIWAGAVNAVTHGFNAVCDDASVLEDALASVADCRTDISQVCFYGAGITDDSRRAAVSEVLRRHFPSAQFEVESDMVGTAKALCGDAPGVACILGTGSNSCLWDGTRIVANTPSLGYLLGDEGSGAVMGRNFVTRLLKHRFSKEVEDEVSLTPSQAIEAVYRGTAPKQFLSGFAPVILRLARRHADVAEFVISQFEDFFIFNITPYAIDASTPVNFTGGVAHNFKDFLAEAARRRGYTIDRIINDPISELLKNF